MGFGAPGFFRDKATTRQPVALEITFLYDQSGSMTKIVDYTTDPDTVTTLELALRNEGVGVRENLPNRYSQVDHSFVPTLDPDSEQSFAGSIWVDGGTLLAQPSLWESFELGSRGTVVKPKLTLGSNTEDVTGGAYYVATLNPRIAVEPASAYRENIQRVMVSFSNEQSQITQANTVLSALTADDTAQIFVGVSSFTFNVSGGPSLEDPDNPGTALGGSSEYIGVIFLAGGSDVIVVARTSSSSTFAFITTPLSTLEITTPLSTLPVPLSQVTNGPVDRGGSQRANTLYLAYKTSGAVFDIKADIEEIMQALGKVLGRYLYELT